jgi:hypothetical protein
VLIPFIMYFRSNYDAFLPYYYHPSRLKSAPFFWEALAGNVISPSRGLFLFSPVFLFSFVGVAIKIRRRDFGLLDALLGGVIVLHWIAISSLGHWWAGYSYGPRFFSDMIPLFIYFLIPVLEQFPWPGVKTPPHPALRRCYVGLFVLCAAFSVFAHARGAMSITANEWNAYPLNIDKHPERLWDWTDPQFLRGVLPRNQPDPPP